MIKSKYLIYKLPEINYPLFVIFCEVELHADVWRTLGQPEVVSAGLIELTGNGFLCSGESVSLNIKSRNHDAVFFNRQFGYQRVGTIS